MVEHTRRRRYQHDRVLIESARILTAQFDDAVVYLSGAQLEMLRNVSQYLRNLNTYVSEYQPGYYLTPDASDYDDILAIVADLEETLMGNPNTIWGYKERWIEEEYLTASGSGDIYCHLTTVPAGEVWVLEQAYAYHNADTVKNLKMYDYANAEYFYFVDFPAASPVIYHRWDGRLVLSEGDRVTALLVAPGDGKYLDFHALGYKMIVPEE